MRLSKKAVEEREQFVRDLFTTNPKTTMKAANEALATKFGSKMRPHRVYAIRTEVRKPESVVQPEAGEAAVAAIDNPTPENLQDLTGVEI